MDFFAAQEQARKKTRKLVFLFVLAVVGTVVLAHLIAMLVVHMMTHKVYLGYFVGLTFAGMFLMFWGVILYCMYRIATAAAEDNPVATVATIVGGLFVILMMVFFYRLLFVGTREIEWTLRDLSMPIEPGDELIYAFLFWDDPLVFCFALLVGICIAGASLYKIRQIARQGGTLIAEQLGGRMIARNTSAPAEMRLLNVMDEMAIAAGIPTPVAFVLPEEKGLNAFAAGLSTQDSVIAVTQGLLDAMDRDELQGIIAHEIGHIVHGDSRLNTKLIGILFGLFATTILWRFMWRVMKERPNVARRGGAALVIIFLMYIAGSVGLFFGRLIQAAVSREREYLADAAAVQFTRHPAGIISAFNKLRTSDSQIKHPQALAANHLFFGASEKPARFWSAWSAKYPPLKERIKRFGAAWFATHPPLEERILHIGGEVLPLPENVVDPQNPLANLPKHLREAATTVSGAAGIVYGLFLSIPEIKLGLLSWQESVIPYAAQPVAKELNWWLHSQPEGARYRLVWLDLVMPTLRAASKGECLTLLIKAKFMIQGRGDGRILCPSEFAFYSILENTLLPPLERSSSSREPLYRLVAKVLAFIAYAGHKDVKMAKAAYQAAMAHSHSPARKEVPFPDREEWSLPDFSQTLLCLARATPLYRKKILEACAIAIQHDGKITPVENELLRAFTQALDCPAPLAVSPPKAESSASNNPARAPKKRPKGRP